MLALLVGGATAWIGDVRSTVNWNVALARTLYDQQLSYPVIAERSGAPGHIAVLSYVKRHGWPERACDVANRAKYAHRSAGVAAKPPVATKARQLKRGQTTLKPLASLEDQT